MKKLKLIILAILLIEGISSQNIIEKSEYSLNNLPLISDKGYYLAWEMPSESDSTNYATQIDGTFKLNDSEITLTCSIHPKGQYDPSASEPMFEPYISSQKNRIMSVFYNKNGRQIMNSMAFYLHSEPPIEDYKIYWIGPENISDLYEFVKNSKTEYKERLFHLILLYKSSNEAIDLLKTLYIQTNDLTKKQNYLDRIQNSNNPEANKIISEFKTK